LKRIMIDPKDLIPTDCPRSLMGVLKFVPMLCAREALRPIIVVPVPSSARRKIPGGYLVCSGNHRAAAAHICRLGLAADVIEADADLRTIREGSVADYCTVNDLAAACLEAAESGGYLKGRWEEYLRMITDSGVVGYNERHTARLAESVLRRGGQRGH